MRLALRSDNVARVAGAAGRSGADAGGRGLGGHGLVGRARSRRPSSACTARLAAGPATADGPRGRARARSVPRPNCCWTCLRVEPARVSVAAGSVSPAPRARGDGSIRPRPCRWPASWRPTPTTGRGGRGLPDVLVRGSRSTTMPPPPTTPTTGGGTVTGQRDLARLGATRWRARLYGSRDRARTVLDLGGGHGWYSAELCRRHPQLSATVLDLPGSARVGREIIAPRHGPTGSRTATETRSPPIWAARYDLVLCFNLVHHLAGRDLSSCSGGPAARSVPGGSLAVHGRVRGAVAAPLGLGQLCSGCSCT